MKLTLEEKIQMVLEGKDPSQAVIPATVTSDSVEMPAGVETQDQLPQADAPDVDDTTKGQSDDAPQEEPVVTNENPLSVDPLVQPEDESKEKVEESKEVIEEMAMDSMNHPTHGKLTWENNGGVHEIKKAGKTVFSGSHEEVASKWGAIKKSLQEGCGSKKKIDEEEKIEESKEILDESEILEAAMAPVAPEHLLDTAYSWHGGMSSPLYSYASTGGRVWNEDHRQGLVNELDKNISYSKENAHDPEYTDEAAKLQAIKDHVLSAPLAIRESKSADQLLATDANLTEEFQAKAKAAFEEELAIRTKAIEEEFVAKVASILEKVEAEKSEYINTLSEKIDTYMDTLSESWAVSNKEILESKARVEISESFMTKLKGLFEEHNVEVPDNKRDIVLEMETKLEEVQAQVKSLTETLQESAVELSKMNREKVIAESIKGMTELDKERMLKLVEDVEYVNEEAFTKKLNVIQESVFMKQTPILNEEKLKVSGAPIVEEKEIKQTTTRMDLYLKALQG